jgi:hypothetical protein
MKGKILINSVLALGIAFSSILGIGNLSGAKTAFADTYPLTIPSCTTVTYSAWGNCINGVQTRDVIDMTPYYCALSANEQAGRSQICGQVLGVKIYANGTLLRGPDYKIYVIKNGRKQRIKSLSELAKYRNHRIINVSAAVIANM